MDTESSSKSKIRKRKATLNISFCVKKERNTVYQKVSTILLKPLSERSKDDIEFLSNSDDIVQQISQRKAQRQKVKDRAQEYEDPVNVLEEKCKLLAEAVINSNHLVVYTGAGISTAACIPDYRGSNGIWTLLQQGKDVGLHDLSRAEPTLTHMALYCLYRRGILKHVVSQNCDGLHLRSGLPRTVLSEVHGNMYLEVCTECKPCNHYLRLFDVTEYTARYSHETLRLCYKCGSPLKDTIVHFGERGKLQWPLNWDTACKQADKADVILCLGSSLKVLKKYPWLWCMDKPVKKRPKLYIVNLQWTPKDDHSTLKINGKCDTVIERMMFHLGLTLPKYQRELDPIFHHATILHQMEMHTTSRSSIEKSPKTASENAECMKKELAESQQSNDDIASMCSSAQDINLNQKATVVAEEDGASSDDLIVSNSLSLHGEVKKESLSDANSDKENEEALAANDDVRLKKSCNKDASLGKSEKVKYDENGQSNLSVIHDKSAEYIVPDVTVNMVAEPVEFRDETENEKDEAGVTEGNAQNTRETTTSVPIQPANEGLNFYYGRNLWSDLSLFDALTLQPVFFGRSIFDLNPLNTCTSLLPYCSANQSQFFNSYFNYANILQNSVVTTNENAVEGFSSGSPSIAERVPVEMTAVKATCSFCFERYESGSCLFYAMHERNDPLDATSACLCCADDEDDEDAPEEPEEEPDKNSNKVLNVNPGWFGKGFRKRVKKRK